METANSDVEPHPSIAWAMAGPDSQGPRQTAGYKWLVVLMLWFVCFLNYADRQTISAVFPELEREFGFTQEQLGLIGSAFMWVYAVCALPAGLICDRLPRKHLILGGCLFWSVVTMATGWCGRFWQFMTVRGLEGFGETFYFPASMSLTSDYHGPRTRSRALAVHQSSVYAGTILGSWIGAWLAMRYGWRLSFYAFGGAGVVLAVVLYGYLREPRRGQSEGHGAASAQIPLGIGQTLRMILRRPAVILLMLGFVAANSVATVFLVWTPSFLKEKFGFSLAGAGLSGTLFIHAASAISVPWAGWVADGLRRRWGGGRIVVQAAGLLGGAVFVAWVGHADSRGALIVAMTLFGLCKGLYDSGIFASVFDLVEPRARGTAAGIMNTVGWGGGAFGPWLVGWIADHGSRPTKIANMSDAISWGAGLYILGAGLLIGAAIVSRTQGPRSG